MADVIDLAERRKAAAPSLEELIVKCVEEIEENWQRFARNNHLNDYFYQSVSAWANDDGDYMSDLNDVAKVEIHIKLMPRIRLDAGWVASFEINGIEVQTPPMPYETYARCFNILLFLKLKREMSQAGITIS